MKIQITITATQKTISVEENCKFSELVQFMQTSFPNNWQEFEVNTKVVINYNNPTYVTPYTPYRTYPWWSYTNDNSGTVTLGNNLSSTITANASLKAGTYNVSYDSQRSTSNENTEL